MQSQIYFRIFGHTVTLAMHCINSAVMLTSIQDEILMKDPQLKTLASMQGRFLTVWNIAFQLAYASLALTCDVLTLTNRDHLQPKFVKKFRDFFFSAVVFPGTLVVFSVFWPFYLYDRSIIFPEFIDKVFSQKSNLVMHLAIVPVVLWELAFQPRNRPKSHKPYLTVICIYFISYGIFLLYTYQQRGLWPYPLMGIVYGTIWNVVLHLYILGMAIGVYYVQWPLSALLWGKDKKKNNNNHFERVKSK